MSNTPPVALTVAGSDSGGGAGIQADLKTFHAFGVFGTSALTAVTVQNTLGVSGVQKIDPQVVADQIRVVAEDLEPAAVKSGMLADAPIIRAVARGLREAAIPGYVLDPVMVAQSGDRLLEDSAVAALREELVPMADLVTPNLDEAAVLVDGPVEDEDGMREAGQRILEMGAGAVLVKGGHLAGDDVVDFLHDGHAWREWRASRVRTANTHGTGDTLSAGVAAGLALGRDLADAVDRAIRFTRAAIGSAPDLGRGSGPLNHWEDVPGP